MDSEVHWRGGGGGRDVFFSIGWRLRGGSGTEKFLHVGIFAVVELKRIAARIRRHDVREAAKVGAEMRIPSAGAA